MIYPEFVTYITNRTRDVNDEENHPVHEAEWALQGMLDDSEFSYIVLVTVQSGAKVRGLLFADEWLHDMIDEEDRMPGDNPVEPWLNLCHIWLNRAVPILQASNLEPFFGPLSGPYHRMEVGFFIPFVEAPRFSRESVKRIWEDVMLGDRK